MTFLSLLACVAGFIVLIFAKTLIWKIIGVSFFSLWCILDCVDGDVARFKKKFSPIGDLWDAAAGYAALALLFLGMGMSAYFAKDHYGAYYVLCGGITAVAALYPRLLMHFKYHGQDNEINKKNDYGLIKMIAFNIISPDALLIPFMYIAVIFGLERIFVLGYGLLYLLVCVYTSAQLLKE